MNENEIEALMEPARRRRDECNYIVTIGDRGATYVGPFSSYERLTAYGFEYCKDEWRAAYVEDPRAPLPVITPAETTAI
jgi:hypothetical protein